MYFKTYTLGCKVNLYESEAIASDLKNHGWELIDDEKKADVIIVNTCTVTSVSDSKSRQLIRKIRRANQKAIIVAMGCYIQLNSQEAVNELDVNIILGTTQRNNIYNLVNQYLENHQLINVVAPSCNYTKYEELRIQHLSMHTRGFIKIQDGCENFCTYCAIPYSRGAIKSRDPEDTIKEITQLVNENVKEIILSGINTGTYGQDFNNGQTLAKLLERIFTEVKGNYRLRLSSIELMEVSDELLEVFRKYPTKMARHLHIPLQAGSDNTLQRMHRKYLTADYERLILKIRTYFPQIAITTDCLAGFVGETEEDFQEALAFIKKMSFAEMHVFPYSRRKGTVADTMENHLDPQIINKRARAIQLLAAQLAYNYRQQFVNQDILVLVEQKRNNLWIGHTTNYLEIAFEKTNEDWTNRLVLVHINDVKDSLIKGTFIKEVNDEF